MAAEVVVGGPFGSNTVGVERARHVDGQQQSLLLDWNKFPAVTFASNSEEKFDFAKFHFEMSRAKVIFAHPPSIPCMQICYLARDSSSSSGDRGWKKKGEFAIGLQRAIRLI